MNKIKSIKTEDGSRTLECRNFGYEFGLFIIDNETKEERVLGYWKTLKRVNKSASIYGVQF